MFLTFTLPSPFYSRDSRKHADKHGDRIRKWSNPNKKDSLWLPFTGVHVSPFADVSKIYAWIYKLYSTRVGGPSACFNIFHLKVRTFKAKYALKCTNLSTEMQMSKATWIIYRERAEESREVQPNRWPEEKRATEVFSFYFYSAKLVPNRGTACLNFFALLTSLSGFYKLACASTVLS